MRRKLAAEQHTVSINEDNDQDSQDINDTHVQISDQDEETDEEEYNTTVPTLRRGSRRVTKKKIS